MAIQWNPKWGQAIANLESRGSGGYKAVGPKTKKGNRAYGNYQVMDFNIPKWTKKHYGKTLTPKEFLENPEAQDAVFKGEFGSYVKKYGNADDAASMWFTGKPLKAGANRSDVLGTTGAGYVRKFNKELGLMPKDENKEIDLNAPMRVGGGQVRNYSKVGAPLGSQAIDNLDAGRLKPVRRSESIADLFAAQKPKTLLERFGIQKMEEGAEGEDGQRFFNRDTFLNFLGGIGAVAASTPQARARAQATVEGRKARAQRNETAKYLAEIGEEDLARAVLKGSISGSEAMTEVFKQRDREYNEQRDEEIYQRDRRDELLDYERDRADTIADREAGYDRDDFNYNRRRQDALADLAMDMEFQEKMLGLRTASQQELAAYKESLLRERPITEYQRLQHEVALEQIRQAEDRLAEQSLVNDANIAQTEATTQQIQLENEKLQNEVDKLENPTPEQTNEVAQSFDEFDIAKFAAGDFAGVFDRGWNQIATRLWGGEGTGIDGEASNVASINNAIRIGLSRSLTDRGSRYSSEQINELLPSINQSNNEQYETVKNLIITLNDQLRIAENVVNDPNATAKMRAEANKVRTTFPNLIPVLERSVAAYESAKGFGTVTPYTEEEQAVDDLAQQIIGAD